MADIQLEAVKREKLGGSTANQLRREGRVPGILYGHGDATIPFHVKELSLRPLIYTQETHAINLSIDGNATRCILREVQFHPVTDRVSHIDLVVLHAGEKIRVDVPVLLKGSAAGAKDGGIVDHIMHKVTVETLPDDIPEHVDVDISDLRIGHSIHVKDLGDQKFTILADENAVIVACVPPKQHEETPADAAAITEPEQIQAKGKKEEEE